MAPLSVVAPVTPKVPPTVSLPVTLAELSVAKPVVESVAVPTFELLLMVVLLIVVMLPVVKLPVPPETVPVV